MNTASIPPAPVMSKALQTQWRSLWKSDLAAHWNQDSDVAAMRRLFGLYDRLAKYEKIGDANPVSAGSTGQQVLHPMLKAADTIRAQILTLEDRFGLTPMARLKLNISLGEAAISLDEMNKRLTSADVDDDDAEDPRITAIETRQV